MRYMKIQDTIFYNFRGEDVVQGTPVADNPVQRDVFGDGSSACGTLGGLRGPRRELLVNYFVMDIFGILS